MGAGAAHREEVTTMARRENLAFGATVATAVATFLLLVVGGIVHATDSGLACPDWPQCFGTFFPPMVGKVFFEHGHRVFATGVGNLAILQLVLVWRSRAAGHPARSLAVAALGLVIFQGVLGGMTVRMRLPDAVSTAHLATSMVFFSLQLALVFRTRVAANAHVALPSGVRRGITLAAAIVYLQIVLGAVVRHTDSGLACTTIPLCRGSLLPLGADWPVVVHMLHRLGAVVTTVAVLAASLAVIRAARANRLARVLALAAPGLVMVQVLLGVLSVMTAIEVVTVTAHLGTGALLLATMVSMRLAAGAVTAEIPALAVRRESPVLGFPSARAEGA